MTEKKPFGGTNPDRHAPNCDDQLPLVSRVGRGIKGDGFRVEISNPDSEDETYLEGWIDDGATHTSEKAWTSENINGGRLSIQRIDRPFTNPSTFALTFDYRRPGREEWSVTTPGIPYFDTGESIASGMSNIFVRESVDAEYAQPQKHGGQIPPAPFPSSDLRWGQINWPHGSEPKDFNAPAPDEAWAATLTFGWGGDIPIPNLTDVADILGFDRPSLEGALNGVPGSLLGDDSVKGYIDSNVEACLLGSKEYTDERVLDIILNELPLSVRVAHVEFLEAAIPSSGTNTRGRVHFLYTDEGAGIFLMRVQARAVNENTIANFPSGSDPATTVWRYISELTMGDTLGTVQVPAGVRLPVSMKEATSFSDNFMLTGVSLLVRNAGQSASGVASTWGSGTYHYRTEASYVNELLCRGLGGLSYQTDVPGVSCTSSLEGEVSMKLQYQGAHIYSAAGYELDGWFVYMGPLSSPVSSPKMLGWQNVPQPAVSSFIYDSPPGVILAVPATTPDNGQTIEFMVETSAAGNGGIWQDSRTFASVGVGPRVFHARAKENAFYAAGPSSTKTITLI